MKTETTRHIQHRALAVSIAVLAVTLAVVPFTAYATTTSTTVSTAIGSTIGLLSSSGTVNIDATPTSSGVQTIASDTVTVSTNNSSGYTLKLGETTATTTLTSWWQYNTCNLW